MVPGTQCSYSTSSREECYQDGSHQEAQRENTKETDMTSPFLSSKSLLTHYNLKLLRYSFFTSNLIFLFQTGSEANSYHTTVVQRN